MKIGELAERSGCLVETIRYYERIGLLMPPERAVNNYRTYNERHSERLLFIRHCRALDMTLDEIRTLLNFKDDPQVECAGVNELLEKHIADVFERIQGLTALEAQLRELRARCIVADTTSSCEILRALSIENSRCNKPVHGSRG